MYNTDLKRLAVLVLPTNLRKSLIYAFLQAAVKPLQGMQGQLNTYRSDCLRRMKHTSQVCYLIDILNYTFLPTTSTESFAIEDTNVSGDWLITYDEEEEPDIVPIIMNETNTDFSSTDYVIVYNENTINELEEAFIVYYPTSTGIEATNDLYNQMKSIVDMYRLASKKAIYKPLNTI